MPDKRSKDICGVNKVVEKEKEKIHPPASSPSAQLFTKWSGPEHLFFLRYFTERYYYSKIVVFHLSDKYSEDTYDL